MPVKLNINFPNNFNLIKEHMDEIAEENHLSKPKFSKILKGDGIISNAELELKNMNEIKNFDLFFFRSRKLIAIAKHLSCCTITRISRSHLVEDPIVEDPISISDDQIKLAFHESKLLKLVLQRPQSQSEPFLTLWRLYCELYKI